MGRHTGRLRLLSHYCMPTLCISSHLPDRGHYHPCLLEPQRRHAITCQACLPHPYLQMSVTVVILTYLCRDRSEGTRTRPLPLPFTGKLF